LSLINDKVEITTAASTVRMDNMGAMSVCVIVANFMTIRQTVAKLSGHFKRIVLVEQIR